MRLRLGFLLGFALGYVLGSKAGRQRYEQIMASLRRLKPAGDGEGAGYPYADSTSVTGDATYDVTRSRADPA
jgi:hypothetical protein